MLGERSHVVFEGVSVFTGTGASLYHKVIQ